ncbi:hypothetical protein ACFYST_32100 [Kitasatospora sp. NPDC004614]|uniref:hypothetical protein n=1 Tax=unclassified Kitasatospora TaxID=2633591 RepID=UPI003694D0AA
MLRKISTAATVLITAAVVTTTSLVTAPLAGASTPPNDKNDQGLTPGSPSSSPIVTVDKATLHRQYQLDALADRITGKSGTEAEHTGGYAGAVVKAKDGELALYWKGAVPQSVKDAQKDAAAQGLKVSVTQSSYSAKELEDARRRLEGAVKGKDATTEPVAAWNSIAVLSNGTGLYISYNSPTSQTLANPSPSEVPAQRVTTVSAQEFATHAQALAGVPVQAAEGPEGTDTYSRHDDSSAFWAGAELNTPGHQFCTSGFAGSHGGSDVVLTASHCGTSGTFTTGTGNIEGWAQSSDLGFDTTFITLNGSAGNQFYDGAWNDPNGYHKHVASWGLNHDGDYVCTSGAMSGVKCNIQVRYAGVDSNIGGITRHNVVQAMRTNTGDHAAAQGDSGGPVVTSPDGTYGNDMQARGLISGSWGQYVACPTWGVGIAMETTCYEGVQFIGMSAIVNTLGFTLYT